MRGKTKKLPYRGLLIKFRVADAKRSVAIERTKDDAALGRRTDPEACMNTNCAMRQASVFPHKVMAAWFFKRTLFVLKSFNSNTNSGVVVRYLHSNTADINKFDRNERLPADKTIHLLSPNKSNRLGARPGKKPGKHGNHKEQRIRPFAPRGLLARAMTITEYQNKKKPDALVYRPN